MDICKNADEYWAELWRLRGKGFREYYSKVTELRAVFRTKDDPSMQDIKEFRKAERNLWKNCLKEAEDFDKRQPVKPVYIFKKGRKYYELQFNEENPNLWISPKPIKMQILKAKNSEWVLEIIFPGSAVDIATCAYCKDKFVRLQPNQKYCPSCSRIGFNPRTNPDKYRYCLNCGKQLPIGKHGKAKYCCGACRTAACKKRRIIASSEVQQPT